MICIYSIHIEPGFNAENRCISFKKRKRIVELIAYNLQKDLGVFSFTGRFIVAFKVNNGRLKYKMNLENDVYVITIKKIHETCFKKLEMDPNQERIIIEGINIKISQILRNLNLFECSNTSKFFSHHPGHMRMLETADIQVWLGMKTSFELLQGGPRLLVDFCTRILRTDNVLVYMKRFGGDKNMIREGLIDRNVVTNYGDRLQNYKIDQVEFNLSPKSLFDYNGRSITYAQYFKNSYKINILDMNQPLLKATPIKKRNLQMSYDIYLVPELCKLIGLSEEDELDLNLMKELAAYSRLESGERIEEISRHVKTLNQELKHFGYVFEIEELKTIDAHQINVPQLTLAKKEIIKPDGKGSFQLRSKIIEPMVLDYWILLYSGKGARYDEEAEKFYNNLAKAASTFGIKVVEPLFLNVGSIQGNDYADTLKKNIDAKVQAVIAFIPRAAENKVYKTFKKACMLPGYPVPSQVVLTSSVLKNAMSVCSKIILQIAAKMGNSLWSTELPEGLPKNIMVMGAISPNSFNISTNRFNKNQSLGFCASSDPSLTKYYSRVKFPNIGRETSSSICATVTDSIKNYFKLNQVLPDLIILYRNNVGHYFFDDIHIEITEIKNSFKIIDEKYNPQFIEVAITQRLNDRFFVPNKDPTSGEIKYCYPPSGTLVMEEVTSSKLYDFYLYGLGGICVPTHYRVVCNESDLTEDMLIKLTYYQCFGYYNWTGAIRVPACLKYAACWLS